MFSLNTKMILKLVLFAIISVNYVCANCCLRYGTRNQYGMNTVYCVLPIPCLGGVNVNQPNGRYPSYPGGYPNPMYPEFGNGWGVSNIPPTGYPGGYPSGYPGGYPSGNPGGYPSGYPNGFPGSYPSGYPGNYPGGYPGNYPNGYPNYLGYSNDEARSINSKNEETTENFKLLKLNSDRTAQDTFQPQSVSHPNFIPSNPIKL